MKGRVADDEDGEEEEDEGDEEEGEGNEGEDEGTELQRGRQARNGAVSAFRTALQASTGQGSKSRQSMNSLEEVVGHVLSSQALPDPLSHAPADAAPLYQKGDLLKATATASYDDCVRYCYLIWHCIESLDAVDKGFNLHKYVNCSLQQVLTAPCVVADPSFCAHGSMHGLRCTSK
jgi:hypothetical protein